MKTFKQGFFSVSTKIIIVYATIIVAFAAALFMVYGLSKIEIDKKQKRVNEEVFLNHVNYIEEAFREMKNNAYELRNDSNIKQVANSSDSLSKFNQINSLSKVINHFSYVDDVFIYDPTTKYFVSAQGSIDIDVYFRMMYSDQNLSGKWATLLQGKEDFVINVTKFPEYELVNRKDFFKRMLYVDAPNPKLSDLLVGYVVDIQKIVHKQNAELNNFFVISGSGENALDDFLSSNLNYHPKANTFNFNDSVNVSKVDNNLLLYCSDTDRNLIYLNVVNMDKYYDQLGESYLPIILVSIMLLLIIVTTSWFLLKYNKNLQNIRSMLEDSFVNSILLKSTGTTFIEDVKVFLGLKGIKQIQILLISMRIKSNDALSVNTNDYENKVQRCLSQHSIRYKSFDFSKLKTILIIDAKSIKDPTALLSKLQKGLTEYEKSQSQISINLYVSGVYDGKDGIEKALDDVVYLNEHTPVQVAGKVVLPEQDMPEYQYIPGELKNRIYNSLASDDKQQLIEWIGELLHNNMDHGISLKNLKVLIAKMNRYFSEAVFEKFPDRQEELQLMIHNIYQAVEEVEVGPLARRYEDLIMKLAAMEYPAHETSDSRERKKLQQYFIQYIEENYNKDIYLETMASHFNLTPKYASSKFKEVIGENFTEYLNRYRITMAKQLLRSTQFKVNQISEQVGYNHVNVFIRQFKSMEGVTPKSYREIV